VAKQWYVLRVQSNREEEVRENLELQLNIEDLKDSVPEILVPTESVSALKAGKRQLVQQKLYPGYVILQESPRTFGMSSGRPAAWGISSAEKSPGPCAIMKWLRCWGGQKRRKRKLPNSRSTSRKAIRLK